MINKLITILLPLSLLIILILFSGCGSFPALTEADWQKAQIKKPEISPERYKRIFFIINDSSFRDSFMETLISTDCYDVVTRDKLNMILREQNLQYSGRFDLETAVKWGKLLGADAIFEISDIRYSKENSPLYNMNIWGYGWYSIKGYDVERGKYILYKSSSRIEIPASGRFGLPSVALTHFLKSKIIYRKGRIVGVIVYNCR